MDLFMVHRGKLSTLKTYEALGSAIIINRKLGFEDFSGDGRFLKTYDLEKMIDSIGQPKDDSDNLFTARMLLLLESRCLVGDSLYDEIVSTVVSHYFRDKRGKKDFKPLFLLNDVLRYWRTLCLNYESIRNDPSRPWHKKNVALKFGRMSTVFSTVLPLIANDTISEHQLISLVKQKPSTRFAEALDIVGDTNLKLRYGAYLDNYEKFLKWKEIHELQPNDDLLSEIRDVSSEFAQFIYDAINSPKIDSTYRRYLVI